MRRTVVLIATAAIVGVLEQSLADPVRGLAQRKTNFIPDVINCELPLDNRRSVGYRRVEPAMTNNQFYFWIGQHETGRYSKAHKHMSAAVLLWLAALAMARALIPT